MEVSMQNQLTEFGKPTELRLALMHQGAVLSCSPIAKFNHIFSDNSTVNADVELFVYPARMLANISKQDQLSASF